MQRRTRAILLTVPLALDCIANALFVDGSIRHTLSGEAWRSREHKHWHWHWTHRFIDYFFGKNHCMEAAAKEAVFGSIWGAWLADIKGY